MRKMKKLFCMLLAIIMTISMVSLNGTDVSAAKKTKAKSITITTKKVSLVQGKSKTLKVKKNPSKAKVTVKWSTSNKNIATVSKKGLVSAKKPGKVTITAKAKVGKKTLKSKCTVTVTKLFVPVKSITLDKTELTVDEGLEFKINASVSPSNATQKSLTYTSSDTNVATVTADGTVKGIAQGTATITVAATDKSGVKASCTVNVTATAKPRAIVTQDGECDDMNSLIHILLYSNEIDIRGIVMTSSSAGHWEGDATAEPQSNAPAGSDVTKPYRWPGTEWMYRYIDDYAKVYPNLIKHDQEYPTPAYLKSVTKVGNIAYVNDTRYATEGSNLVKKEILANDDRTLYLMSWGGPNTISRALMDIEAEYKDKADWESLKKKITDKCIICGCFEQDNTYANYISQNWPGLAYVNTAQMSATAFAWWSGPDDENKACYQGSWMRKNLVKNHGALLDEYMTWGDGKYYKGELDQNQFGYYDELMGSDRKTYFPDAWISGSYNRYDFISEGDSPCWLMLVNNGLRDKGSVQALANGGYSGRFALNTSKNNYWSAKNDASETSTRGISSEWRWISSIMNDFAARADWCITSDYKDANHAPKLSIQEGVDFEVKAGEAKTLKLHALASDPDDDYVTVSWEEYTDAETYSGTTGLTVKYGDSDVADIVVPADAVSGDRFVINVQAKDNGEHTLVHYQQVIISVK